MTDPNKRKERINLADELQDLLLQAYKDRLVAGELSDTGLSALQKLLMANGMNLDPSQIQKTLGDQLTSKIDPEDLEDTDPDVLDIRRRQSG